MISTDKVSFALYKKYKFITNNFILGVNYTNMMDSGTIEYEPKNLIQEDILIETLYIYVYGITIDKTLKQKINKIGFNVTNYKI